jgi:putative mRNA 3-end processing factor
MVHRPYFQKYLKEIGIEAAELKTEYGDEALAKAEKEENKVDV